MAALLGAWSNKAGSPARSGKRWRRREPGVGQSGFTLLEMLVAVAILAVLAGLIPRSFVYARALINRSESWVEARVVAESVLHGELAGHNLRAGARRGTVDGRAWTATLQPDAVLSAGTTDPGRVLLRVRLVVAVSPVENMEVETIRTGSPQ